MNGELIGEANANTPSIVIEFPILVDSELEIREEGPDAVIKVTDFEMVDCTVGIIGMIKKFIFFVFWLRTNLCTLDI